MKGYSFPYDPEVHAAARGKEMSISPRHAREICRAIRGMELERARGYLGRVIEMREPVPFTRHAGKDHCQPPEAGRIMCFRASMKWGSEPAAKESISRKLVLISMGLRTSQRIGS